MVKCYLVLSLFRIAREMIDGIGECENWKCTVTY